MSVPNTNTWTLTSFLSSKIKAYAAFTKLRLASLVVFSSVVSYFMAADTISWITLTSLISGGFLVTASSNGFNQVIEKEQDAIMTRTQKRPIPSGEMTVKEGMILALLMGVVGIFILSVFVNPLTGLLGGMALIMYVGIYTPMKRTSSFAVFVGAFPGAIPPMLGYIAETGQFGLVPGLLFAIQFVWQFPHFWAIAWKLHDDYQKAGYFLLPSAGGRDQSSGFQTFIYALFLIPTSLTPYFFGVTGSWSAMGILALGIWFAYIAFQLYTTLSEKAATKLMFASFIYLPVVQILLWVDKI